MSGSHLALIVEDDRSIADDLAEILKSLECHSVITDNKRDALAEVQRRNFCFILLDLEIKLGPDSIKGHTEHGSSLLRECRKLHADHTGRCYWLPILIVSGFAREVMAAVEVMKDGAHDVIQKPFISRDVSEAVRRALELSGRATHDQCSRTSGPVVSKGSDRIVLTIPGDRVARRTRVMFGARSTTLIDSSLKILLHLMVAHATGKRVHKRDLGARDDQGFKGISVLRDALRPALADGVDIIENDHQGSYSLTGGIFIGACDTEKLTEIGDRKIAELARELGLALNVCSCKSDGKS